MADMDGKIWMDGEFVPWREAKVHVLTHTLHYGCGAFEGVRAYKTEQGPAIFRLPEHTRRLFNSAKILRMPMPFTEQALIDAQCEVVRQNQLSSCYIRPLVFIGAERLGVSPKGNRIHVIVAACHGARIWAKRAWRAAFESKPAATPAITSTSP